MGKGPYIGLGSGYARDAGAGFGGRGTRVPTVRQAKPETTPAFAKDAVGRIVRAHLNEVRKCYAIGLARDPNRKGRVAVRFTVEADGKVLTAELAERSLPDLQVADCIVTAVKRWAFPRPLGGPAVITYPFILEPG